MQTATVTHPPGNVTPINSASTGGVLAVLTEERRALALKVMGDSLYPGAKPESVVMAYEYCQAQGLDPLLKPVHIMQVSVKGPKDGKGKDTYDKRDVILPGIGLYRTMAARTGCYAGMTEPEFGPNEILGYRRKVWEENPAAGKNTSKWVDEEVVFPAWCKITVRKIVAGVICEFTAVEYWLENYATAGRDTDAPNEMWRKRVRGQIAKCTEAQALRKAFPEVGSLPTMEEMEGRVIDLDAYNAMTGRGDGEHEPEGQPTGKPMPRRKSDAQADLEIEPASTPDSKHGATDVSFTEGENAQAIAEPARAAQPARRTESRPAEASRPATAGMLGLLRVKAKQRDLTEADLMKRAGVDAFEKLTIEQGNDLLAWIANPQE